VQREFLHFIAFSHHSDIPLAALATSAMKDFTEKHKYLPRPEIHKKVVSDLGKLLCVDGKWSELQVQSTIRILQAFSATSIDDSIFLQLHPLIQAWSRDMVPSASQHYRAMAVQVVTACCRMDAFRLHRYLLSHIFDLLACINAPDLQVNEQVAVTRILRDHGYYQNATGLLEAAARIISDCDEQDKGMAPQVAEKLALAYSHEGKWSEAGRLGLEVLEQRKAMLGLEHPDTTSAASNLSMTYWKQGRQAEAEKLQLEVLEQQRRRVLRVEHPDTILAAANLASTYLDQGRYTEAEKLDLEVLEQEGGAWGRSTRTLLPLRATGHTHIRNRLVMVRL
jgi:Tetratricopeptide repeat